MKPITAFFGAPKAAAAAGIEATKRVAGAADAAASSESTSSSDAPASPSKRARKEASSSEPATPSSSGSAPSSGQPISPELIEEKRLQALAKRQEKAAAAAAAAAVAAPPLTNAVAPASKAGVGYDGLEKRTMGPSWYRVLQPEFSKAYFVKLHEFLESERAANRQVFPPADDIYSWSQMCSFDQVRVVILGQDPYHDDNQAHGCAFSVRRGVAVPPSLANIYKELESCVPGFTRPRHGYLKSWCTQGVLLLNTCLTVRAHAAKSHAGQGWEQLTDAVVRAINTQRTNVVFMLWGKPAQTAGKSVNASKHLVLKAAHPSPLSAHAGFYGCKHFALANEYLTAHHLKPIDWNSVNGPE